MKWILAASLAALGLAGCVSYSSGDVILPLPQARAATASIGDIVLTGAPATVSADFPAIFQREVREQMDKCARGGQPLRMEVRIIELTGSNAAMAYLVGDSNVIRAQVALVEPGTGEKVADYDVSRSVGGGGLIAAVAMAEAEEQMSAALATDVCERAFGQRP
ncbi:hypothetical protein [Brevundimonas sp.]|uniref:hypothetical protein n=1 Tax=Brevundimonas sp. TaxID=1871086 RepID=UPI002D4D2305|nr:hypothetical protein [Brevundimonas sp.]HYD26153.1 hypothetical protein [Brevundimonas sp.]